MPGPTTKAGFSILELVAAVAILAIIGGIGFSMFSGGINRAKIKRAKADIYAIQRGLEDYYHHFGEYPKPIEGDNPPSLDIVLFNCLSGGVAPNGTFVQGPSWLDRGALTFENRNFRSFSEIQSSFLSNKIIDPWGHPYRYQYNPDDEDWVKYGYTLYSVGPDGKADSLASSGLPNKDTDLNEDNIYAE